MHAVSSNEAAYNSAAEKPQSEGCDRLWRDRRPLACQNQPLLGDGQAPQAKRCRKDIARILLAVPQASLPYRNCYKLGNSYGFQEMRKAKIVTKTSQKPRCRSGRFAFLLAG